ncbi:hypothetical protein [Gellertiella hungarica]|uniref:Terminase small subunit n=1 Tax=Gellertiella hungarica TaxID=1572859 RepID=A0A7W6J8J9_9HYPH|nr:hypothetical protein [Gellertiella hungarica]MBB4066765.1 hypothetical protein [Gellertiella hungarica]
MVMPSKKATDYGTKARSAAALLKADEEKKEAAISEKARTAVELMVFEGLKRSDAAKKAGMHEESLRRALTKPNTLAYMNECMEVLRTSVRPRALLKMESLLDAKNESTQFKAAEYLDGMNRGSHTIGAAQVNVQINNSVQLDTPGYVIRLARSDERLISHQEQIEAKPLPSQQDVPDDE